MKTTSLFSLVLFSLCGVTANGTVINADGNIFTSPAHPGAILDTSTKLLWLDATETENRSLADVTSKLGVGQEFEGWQLASKTQIDQLFANAGLSDTNHGFVSNASEQADVISFVGIYGQTESGEQVPTLMGTNVWHADTFVNAGLQGLMSAVWLSTDDNYWVGAQGVSGIEGTAINFAGVALVRAIPEPTTFAMVALGIMCMDFRGRRRALTASRRYPDRRRALNQ